MNEQLAIAAAAAATVAAGYCYIRICQEVHHWDDPEVAENKGVDTSSPSGKMLWTAPLGDGTKIKGGSASCPFPPQPPHHEPHYLIQLTGTGLYLSSAYRWVRPTGYALRFGSVTAANAYAVCQLGLRLDEYTIEYVAGVTVTPINRGENRL